MKTDSIANLKAIHERLGSLLIFLEDGQLDDEGLRRAMRLLKSFAFDLRAAAEKLRQNEAIIR